MFDKVVKLMGRCMSNAGEFIPASKQPRDISKFVFERYANAKNYSLKLFLYSAGSATNNVPYTFDTQLSKTTKDLVENMLIDVFEVNDTNLDDLFRAESVITDIVNGSNEESDNSDFDDTDVEEEPETVDTGSTCPKCKVSKYTCDCED